MENIFVDKKFNAEYFMNTGLLTGEYDGCVFEHCDFSNGDFSTCIFLDCRFEACNLSLVKLNKTVFRDVVFKDCKMLGLHFEQCNSNGLSVNFEQCILNQSSFYQCKLIKTRFKNCQLQETDFTEADISASVCDRCDFRGAAFEQTNLEKTDMRGSMNFDIDPEKNKIKKAKFSHSEIAGLLMKYNIEIDYRN
ncbi:MAG: pentapeptide repeat-containing protein [Bacteroidetes bacterium]|nr:pentapeptide repeat-containing protein [Bacteroidota bacterium]